MRGHILEVFVPGLHEARRTDGARALVATQRVIATRDALTGLLNEEACEVVGRSVLTWAARHNEPVSIVLLLLGDRPATVAASLQVAGVLDKLLEDGDVGARVGDGEFAVVLANGNRSAASGFCATVWAALGGGNGVEAVDGALRLTFTTVTAAPGTEDTFSELLERVRQEADPQRAARAAERRSFNPVRALQHRSKRLPRAHRL